MEDLEEVRARMRMKKQPPVLTQKNFDAFYRFAISTMSLVAVVLAVGCLMKGPVQLDVYEFVDQHILSILPSFNQEAQEVASTFYEQMDDGSYVGANYSIYALKDGVVKEVNEDSFTILYKNDVSATYSSLGTIEVSLYDRIEEGEVLGTYEESFKMRLTKDGQEIDYETFYS